MIPRKLKKDAIIEALCEVHFQTDATELGEIILGRLSDCREWRSFSKHRLPVADIPASVRESDPHLKFQPVLELRDNGNILKIGNNVISYHILGQYRGWQNFKQCLEQLYACLFTQLKNPIVLKICFRYVNALTSADHLITNIQELNCSISLSGNRLDTPLISSFPLIWRYILCNSPGKSSIPVWMKGR